MVAKVLKLCWLIAHWTEPKAIDPKITLKITRLSFFLFFHALSLYVFSLSLSLSHDCNASFCFFHRSTTRPTQSPANTPDLAHPLVICFSKPNSSLHLWNQLNYYLLCAWNCIVVILLCALSKLKLFYTFYSNFVDIQNLRNIDF